MVQSVQLPHYSRTSLNNYIFQSGTTHKMIFQRKKRKKNEEIQKWLKFYSARIYPFVYKPRLYGFVSHVWWEKNSFWLNCDWLRQKHELLISGYFQENCVWTFSLFTTVFGGLIRSTWIIWDLYVCKLKNHF